MSQKAVKVNAITTDLIAIVGEEEAEDSFIQMIAVTTVVRLATTHTIVSCILVEVVVDRRTAAEEDHVPGRGRTEEADAHIPGVTQGREVVREAVVATLAPEVEVTPGLAQEAGRHQGGETPLEEDHAHDPEVGVINHTLGLQVEEDPDPKAGHLVKVMVNENITTQLFSNV